MFDIGSLGMFMIYLHKKNFTCLTPFVH